LVLGQVISNASPSQETCAGTQQQSVTASSFAQLRSSVGAEAFHLEQTKNTAAEHAAQNPPIVQVNGLTVDMPALKAVVKQMVDDELAKLPPPAPGPVGPVGPTGPQGKNGSCDCTTTLDPLTCNVAPSFQAQYGTFICNGAFDNNKHNWAFSPQVIKRKTGKDSPAGFRTIEDCSKLCSKVDGCLAWAWQYYDKVKGTKPDGSSFDWAPHGWKVGDNFCGLFFDDTSKCNAVCGNPQYWRETFWPSPGTCNGVCHRPAWSSRTCHKSQHWEKYFSSCVYKRI